MDLTIAPQPKQKEALLALSNENGFPVVGYGGAKGGGKSKLVRDWMLLRRDKYPNTHGVIIRKTYPELQDSHIKKFFEEFPQLRGNYNKAEKVWTHPTNGSTISFRHIERLDDVYKFQGAEFEDIALDEAGQHIKEVFATLRTSNRTTKSYIKPRMLLTFNPGGVGHNWLKKLFIQRQFEPGEVADDFAFIQASVYDNQALIQADPNYIKTLEALPEKKKKAYLFGDWDSFEGQFFEEWSPSKHVIQPRFELAEAPTNFDYVIGLDDGDHNPRSMHVLAQNNDAMVECIWEYYMRGETIDEAAYKIKESLQKEGIYDLLKNKAVVHYDPSMRISKKKDNGGSWISSIDIFRNITGLRVEPANNERVNGAKRVRSFISWDQYSDPLLKVWNTCPHVINTMPELVYDGVNSEDLDTTGEDHAYDSLRYALMGLKRLPVRFTRQSQVINDGTPEWFKRKKSNAKGGLTLNPLAGI